ncbi:MAG: regulatory protein RecX [Candidatus Omnitrophota bacterium]
MLLKFRLRSEKEVRDRLKKKKFDAETIEDTVSFLKEKAFIDDEQFARAWIRSRVKKPLGIRRLKVELRLKGIDKAIIDAGINELKSDYSEEDVVKSIAKNRLSRLKGIDQQKAKKRVYAYLLRRGFSPESIIEVLNK